MKNVLILFVLSGILYFTNSQTITEELKDTILSQLRSTDYFVRTNSISMIRSFEIPEAVPILENIIWNQDRTLGNQILKILKYYNSPNYNVIAKQYFDKVDTMRVDFPSAAFKNLDEIKLGIIFDLFAIDDYTKVNYLFDYIESKKPNTFWGSATLLNKVLKYVPEYYQQAKNELFRIASLDGSALIMIIENFGAEANESARIAFIEAPDPATRQVALQHLIKQSYPNLENILKDRIFMDTVWTSNFSENLLNNFGSIQNYKYIKDNLAQVNSFDEKESIIFTLNNFQPVVPSKNIDLLIQLYNLTENVDTLLTYTWLGDLTFSNELKNILTIAKTDLQNGDSLACRVQVKTFQDLVDNVYKDSLNTDPRFVTIEGWKFLYWNAQYILDRLPEPQANPNLLVNLKNSLGVQIPASNVTYYESAASGWKDAVNNGDGTFTVITTKPTVSIRMFYEYANQTVHNVPAQNNTYTFTTVNAAVELRNSSGNLIDQGTVQYYAGAWRNFGTTTNGVANKELLPVNYSFRMTYEYVPNDKQQDISTNSTVTFTTVLCTVKVTNSNNQPLAGASTKYYSLAWRDIGLTNSEGIITKELLPKNLSFRASYGNATKDKQQDTGVNNLVEIQLNTQ